jgi:hypothetical protein
MENVLLGSALRVNDTPVGVMSQRWIALLAVASFSLPARSAELPSCMLGRWKSDESRTLEDMRRHPEVTEKAKEVFGNNFFGRLIVVFGSNGSTAYFEGEQPPDQATFTPYEIVESKADSVVLRVSSSGVEWLSKWYCDEDSIYTHVSKWEFREYFRRLH